MQNILLPLNYSIPWNVNEDADVNVYILEAGYKIYQFNKKYQDALTKARYSFINSDLKEEHEQTIKELKESHVNSIRQLTEELDKVKLDSLSQNTERVKHEENKYTNIIRNLTERLEEYEKTNKELKEIQLNSIKRHMEELDKVKLNLTKHNSERTEEYRNKIAELEKQIETIADEKNKFWSSKYNNLESLMQDNIQKLNKEITDLTVSRSKAEQEIRTTIEQTYQDTIKVERERWAELNAQHNHIVSSLASNQTTVSIGNLGEEMISNWTRELFNTVEITDTSGMTAKGDLHVKIQNKIFLIEVKNRINIQRVDIEKFVRDVESNVSDIHGGLFVSLNSPAIPNKGDFSLEYINEIPVIYLHVPDKQTLRVALKTLLFLNNKSDSTLLSMVINQIYTNLKAISSATVSMSKNLDDSRVSLDSLKKEVRKAITQLDQLFEENPDVKIDSTSQTLEFTTDEIKKIHEVYTTNKKAKMADYIAGLNVNAKYLQDRGGAARIKSICASITQAPLTNLKFNF